ncbi:helix-turn-helix domain-containing protein [Streptomyces sp. NPDC013178]|uniref:helix-turn-helix domain-containing protein n=1 Tax=unclassified Streptomyces TaxID=2593676 RepID=UPI003404423C
MTHPPDTPLPPPEERRRLRETSSLTQAQLAERLGVSRETVRAWETGRTNPRGRRREAYAQLLTSLACPAAGERQVTARPETAEPRLTARPETGEPELTALLETGEPKPTAPPETDEPELTARPEKRTRKPTLPTTSTPPTDPAAPTRPHHSPFLTPAQAFDALYAFCAPALVRQTYLLTGRRELARESVERAFQIAWQRWPEVAVDPEPAGWVRAVAYEYALSPWHRFRPRFQHPEPPPADAAGRALLDALLTLPPPHRRTLLLHDGVGLGLPETAAETEASTPAAANRLLYAREAVATRLPHLADPAELHRRLAELASAERLHAARPPAVRMDSERRARFWTRAAVAFTVALISATSLTLCTAPTRYEPPVPPGETVRGVPPRPAPGPLSAAELSLRAKLRSATAHGPERLLPEPR